jgi:hypothetical protein
MRPSSDAELSGVVVADAGSRIDAITEREQVEHGETEDGEREDEDWGESVHP